MPTTVFINEIHYDNEGVDIGEFIEIAGPAGFNLTGWSLVLYNGSSASGAAYDTKSLDGIVLSDQGNEFGTTVVNYPSNGIQNGAPDGIALVDNNGEVVQFLSYEGSFTAVGGPANGLTSTDIGVAESGSTLAGDSLQLQGSGTTYEDFTWTAASNDSPGNTNAGQSFLPTETETFQLQLLHAADQEAGIPALDDAPRFSAVLNALKNQDADNDGNPDYLNTLVLSSGDAYIPSLFLSAGADPSLAPLLGKEGSGRADIIIQNELGFGAIAFGNHEFDFGTSFVKSVLAVDGAYPGANFPYLSSNLDFSTDDNLKDLVTADGQEASTIPNKIAKSTVITVNGEKIGVVGATTPTLRSISSPGNVGVLPADPNDIAALAAEIQISVDALKATGINKIILLAHMQQISIEQQLAVLLKDVDIIMAGGSNTRLIDSTDRLRAGDTKQGDYPILTKSATGDDIAIINTDGNYKYVGRLVVEFDDQGKIIPSSIDPNISGAYATDDQGVADLNAEDLVDPEIKAITDALRQVILAQDSNILGITEVFLNGARADIRTQETNLGNLTADANLDYVKPLDPTVVVSVKNGGGIRNSIGRIVTPPGSTESVKLPPEGNSLTGKPEGGISQPDVQNALSFNNALSLITVTAAQLQQVLEHGVAATAAGATPGQFPQVGGVSFSFDPTKPAGQRVQNAAILNEDGTVNDILIKDGQLQGEQNRGIRLVTLTFLADGGDSYPFADFVAANPTFANRVDLTGETEDRNLNGVIDTLVDPATFDSGLADFAASGSEQDAFAEYLAANFNTTPFDFADVGADQDLRIQNLSVRSDTVLPPVNLPNVQITEYMYSGNDEEFIEFTNLGTNSVDLTGWSFDDDSRISGTFDLSALGIVQPGESIILTEADAATFRTAWGLSNSVKIIGGYTNNLGREDEINLFDNNSQLVDRLTYGDQRFPGTIRTQNVSGWTEVENLVPTDISDAWQLSVVGDAQNSYTSTGGDVGNPGVYVTGSTPTPGVIITQSDNITDITEGGATDTYTIVLRTQPSANVIVNITPDSQATTNVNTLTFTSANWNVAQTVTVTAVDDAIIESNHSSAIAHTVTSSDTNYNEISIPTVTANITDNDFGSLKKIGGFTGDGAEITAYDPVSQRLFVVDGTANIQILNFSDPTNLTSFASIDLSAYGISANSVAVKNGLVAVAIEAANGVDPGKVVFYDTAGTLIGDVTVGVLPDMVTFSPDGTKVLTANEGQRTDDADPIGSVSIIDVSQGAAAATVSTASFTSFDGQEDTLRNQGVRISPDKAFSLDAEPEYITFSQDGTQAWVTLQENNAVALVDVATATVTQILPLGVVDHSLPGNELDASDRDDAINIQNWPVSGLFMPDAIASFAANGRTYYVTANEGDTRDDDARVSTLTLDSTEFPDAATLQQPNNLGRLVVSTIDGDTDGDGDYDQLFAYGTRSFSIWDDQGNLVYDSGSAFEKITAQQVPGIFNSDGEETASFDTRSDNKGPEPEGVTTATINNRTYAFIGLERIGGVMIYEVTNPEKPQFIEYSPAQPGDLAPEGLVFIAANDSPNGKNLLVVSNEVSKTVTVYEVNLPTRISDIQGTAHRSSLEGQQVTDVQGIVTAVAARGFYLQDPNPDTNDATSEAIFVFTNSAPTVAVGDSLEVSGTVTEFRPGNNANNLTITQITSPTVVKLSSGNTLPSATILGNGGRTIPTTVIDNDTSGNIETGATTFDPAEDGVDFYESLEGMLVQVNNPVSTSPTANFGTSEEIWVLADNGANATGRTVRGGSLISSSDFNPERIQIDDLNDALVLPEVNVGTQLSTVVGVVDYNFNNYEVLVSTAPTIVQNSTLEKEVTDLTPTTNQLTVATFNVENLDPGDGAAQFDNIANRIVNNLKSPDIISLEEIQDNNGATNDSVVDASVTFQTLIDAIAAAGGPAYEYRQINPVDDTNGGQPGGNIRVGFLFNPSRVDFVDKPGATSTSNTTVTNVNGVPTVSASPGLIDPTNSAFIDSRKPLVGEFTFNGQTVYVIANHFNSKGGDQPLFGPNQPPTLTSEAQRQEQATIVKNFVQSLLAINPNANVALVGDLNDFEFSNPLSTLESAGLNTLIETLPENERYTYNFQGNAQTLDHILVSNNLLSNLDGFDVVHFNSEFYDQDSDHDPVLARFNLPGNLINGTPGRETLTGTSGDDIITGYQGADSLTGGAGSDQFVYTSLRDGRDIITDFAPGIDKIVFTSLFQSLNLGSLNYATATAQGYLGFSTQGNNTNILIDQDGAAGLTSRGVPLITVQGVSQTALANSANFTF